MEHRSLKTLFNLISIVMVLTFSLFSTIPVFADDATPPAPTEEPVQPPTDEPVATEEPVVTEEVVITEVPVTEEPAATEPPIATEEPVGTEVPGSVSAAGESEPVVEMLEILPEGTEVVVLDDEGNPEPLATQDAADIIENSDPMWCPVGVTPGGTGCTDPYLTVTDLIAALGTSSGAGTIYFTSTYSTGDATFDQLVDVNLANLTDLTIQGGWNGLTGAGFQVSGVTTFSVPLSINWGGNVTINDIQILGVGGAALELTTEGSVVLDNVQSTENIMGAIVSAAGDINITNSTFAGNFFGLQASSSNGSATLNDVDASGNLFAGAMIQADGEVNITNSTFNDAMIGLMAVSTNDTVTLNNVDASGNFLGSLAMANGSVFIENSMFNNNEMGGLALNTPGDVSVICSEFKGNGGYGIDASTVNGSLTLDGVTFGGNTLDDYIYNGDATISAGCNATSTIHDVVLYYILEQTEDLLPAALGEGNTFASALKVILTPAGEQVSSLTISLAFPIPEGMQDAKLAVMFWNGSGWVTVPGGEVKDGYFVITISQPGFYVLVSQP